MYANNIKEIYIFWIHSISVAWNVFRIYNHKQPVQRSMDFLQSFFNDKNFWILKRIIVEKWNIFQCEPCPSVCFLFVFPSNFLVSLFFSSAFDDIPFLFMFSCMMSTFLNDICQIIVHLLSFWSSPFANGKKKNNNNKRIHTIGHRLLFQYYFIPYLLLFFFFCIQNILTEIHIFSFFNFHWEIKCK